MITRSRLLSVSAATVLTGLALLTPRSAEGAPANPTLLQQLNALGNFTTLETALALSGLDLVFDDPNVDLTLFAPNDDAFNALPPSTLQDLINDPRALYRVLTYHAVAPGLLASDVITNATLDTLGNQRVDISLQGPDVFIDQAKVLTADLIGCNGVAHEIDAVLLPNLDNLVGTAVAAGDFNSLLTAVGQIPGLAQALASPGDFTVFAPNDAAFAKIPANRLKELLADKTKNRQFLKRLLLTHVVPQKLYADELVNLSQVTTLSGIVLDVVVSGPDVFVGGARVIATDVEATNGNIHVLEDVILP